MLQRAGQGSIGRGSTDQAMARDFQTYMTRQVRTAPRTDAERDAVFRQFMLWREQQRKP
jgi:hypothetical protein